MGRLVLRTSGVVGGGGGALTDGVSVNVTGPAETRPTTVEWFGDSDGIIESGSNGATFSRSGWTQAFSSEGEWKYSTTGANSRTKVLLVDYVANGSASNGRGTYYFDYGVGGYTDNYRSGHFYWDVPGSVPQWKIWRWAQTQNVTDLTDPSAYCAQVAGSGDLFLNIYNQHSPTTNYMSASPSTQFLQNAWMRVESWFRCNSPAGTANGTHRFRVTNLSTGATVVDSSLSSILFRGNSPDPGGFRNAVWQHYNGNAGTPDHGNAKIRMEEVMEQNGWVRAELVNNATYASATKRSLCKVNSIVGTTWNIKPNKGAYAISDYTHWALFGASSSSVPTMVAVS